MRRDADREWPASSVALEAGREFLRRAGMDGLTIVAYHGDADGLCAGILVLETLRRLGARRARPLAAGKGEAVHSETMRRRLRSTRPTRLVVVDMGSRAEPVLPGTPTLIVDHHQPVGIPRDAVFVSSFDHSPIAPASLLTFILASSVVDLKDREWLAVVGTVADLGPAVEFPLVTEGLRRHGKRNVTETVALLNAAKRSAEHDVETAFAVVERATSPADVAQGRVDGVDRLRQYRREVADEVSRASRTRPIFAGRVALLCFSSGAQVHPLVAIRWARRLPNNIVVAANYGYLPGRVNFAVRSMLNVNLVDFLRGLGVSDVEGEYGYGHPRASGGSLAPEDFARLLREMGFGSACH